jgi:hypothetical protein
MNITLTNVTGVPACVYKIPRRPILLLAFFLCAGGLSAQNGYVLIGDDGTAQYTLPGQDPSMSTDKSYMSGPLYFQSSDGPHSGDTGLQTAINPGSDGYYGAVVQAQSRFSTLTSFGSSNLSAYSYTSTGLAVSPAGAPGARQFTVEAGTSADATWHDQLTFLNPLLPIGTNLSVQISLRLDSTITQSGIAGYDTNGNAQVTVEGNGQGFLPGLSLTALLTPGLSPTQYDSRTIMVENGGTYQFVGNSADVTHSTNTNYLAAAGMVETGSVQLDVSTQFAIDSLTPGTTYTAFSGTSYPSDIVAVPEPATWVAGFLTAATLLGSMFWCRPLNLVKGGAR